MEHENLVKPDGGEALHWSGSETAGLGNLILARISSARLVARATGKKPSTIRCESPCTRPHAAMAARFSSNARWSRSATPAQQQILDT